MAAVEQQRLEQQQQLQTMGAGMEVETGARVDLRRERSAPPAPAVMNPDEGLGLETSAEHFEPSACPSSPTNRRPTRTSLLSTSTAPSNFTATATGSNSVWSNGSQSKRASVGHAQQTPTPTVSPRPSSANGFPTTPSSPAIPSRPSFKARISTPKPGRPFKISLSTVLGRDGEEGSSTKGLATPVEKVPPPVSPSPTSLVVSNARAQPPVHAGTLIDTRPSTTLSDYEADDDEERNRERPHSWLAEVRGREALVLGGLTEDGQDVSSSSAARALAGMGELKSPGLYSVWTSTTAAETGLSGSKRKNTFDENRAGGEGFGKVPFPRSRSRP
ncbi:hypothetical protein FRC01_002558 [Tulasnella sp. 417]|nr:hypothetical protein FRC01_002558 [Tulasnella sp. 417]